MANMEGATLIGIVLVTHGALADELRRAMEHVVGPQSNTATVCIGPDDDMEQRRDDILKLVEAVDTGSGVIVLTDMFGGTPSNLAISIMEKPSIEVIAGVNLPMLVKLASIREITDRPRTDVRWTVGGNMNVGGRTHRGDDDGLPQGYITTWKMVYRVKRIRPA